VTEDGVGAIEPVAAGDVTFAETVDVVVVGLGVAGTCATIAAAEAGAEVLALERGVAAGGTSALSGGLIYLGGGTPVQTACGYEDSAGNMERFLLAACGARTDPAKIHAYCEGSVAHYQWLVDHGVPFKGQFNDEPNREPFDDSGLVFSGGEDSWPFTDVADPVPRGHHPQFPDTAGGFLMECLGAAREHTAAVTRTDVRVDRLVTDGDAVVGVVARVDDETRAVRARGGVVLAAGGFVYNDAMLAHYCPPALRPHPAWRVGQPHDDGRGVRLGQGARGALRNMDAVECALPIGPPHRLARAILVNRAGERFVNEDTYTGRIGMRALLEQDGDVFMIVSEEIFEVNFVGMRLQWAAETAAELARDIGLPEAALERTVAEYNAGAERGEDPAWHKLPPYVVPLRAPLGAVDLRVDHQAIYAPFTLGGLATDAAARVLDDAGAPVPGLFAAGRTTAGIAADGYVSGISLGDGSFFGRRAGAGAAGV
jgi:3-oxo-5alpha-steroid 4-dehydrogenase